MAHRNREEAVNTQLAVLISELGVEADGETIHRHGSQLPDVIFELRGLRVVIEGKFADHSDPEKQVLVDAFGRVRTGLAHIAAAAIYPTELRSTPTRQLLGELKKTPLKYQILSEASDTTDWLEGPPADLMNALRRAQETMARDDAVQSAAESLSQQLEEIASGWASDGGACDRLSRRLGVEIGEEDEAKAADRREEAAKVAALVLANAMIFQEQLAPNDSRVSTLSRVQENRDIVNGLIDEWRWIRTNVNYVPIFLLAEDVLRELPSSRATMAAVASLVEEAKAICRRQVALRHDLMGRIYHHLLHEAKYLGTYYTQISSATLLMKLAFAAEWDTDLGDPRQLADFKVADLACGTGTLLMAAAQEVLDQYIRSRARVGRSLNPVDLRTLHAALMENVLHGYDILPSAVHLTASTLALLAPEVAFRAMNLYVMPHGVDHGTPRLGSLDFIDSNRIATQMALDHSHTEVVRTGASFSQATTAVLPDVDLHVMNPPFVRSVGGNLLFGSEPGARADMQKELRARTKELKASSTAGLGGVFVALADKRLKPGGRIALVLPHAVASGEAWGRTRALLAHGYDLEYVVTSHDVTRLNFSENTDLSEVLIVARKRDGSVPQRSTTTFVNLWRNPRTVHEALDLGARVTSDEAPAVDGREVFSIASPSGKLGEVVSTPAPEAQWTGALFAQTELLRTYWSLSEGAVAIAGEARRVEVPKCELRELGSLGYDRRDIHDAFEQGQDLTPYPAFWGHKSAKVETIAQAPNSFLSPRLEAAKNRKLKNADAVWNTAARCLLVERLRINTHKVLGVGFDRPVLGNTWWAFDSELSESRTKALLVWLNSSLGFLSFFGSRVVTEGAFVQMKKPAWLSLGVLDVRALPTETIGVLSEGYEQLASQPLRPWAEISDDPTRMDLDTLLEEALGLPSLEFLRALLAREPGVSSNVIGSD